jgi:hypothetical protein
MLERLKRLFEPSADEIVEGLKSYEAVHGRPYFSPQLCPFSKYVRENGVVTRLFRDTRYDN